MTIRAKEKVFHFVETYMATNQGRSPTLREIVSGAGVSSTSVARYVVESLVAEGRLGVLPGAARSITLLTVDHTADPIYDLAWDVIDAWDGAGLGEAIRVLRRHLEVVAPRGVYT